MEAGIEKLKIGLERLAKAHDDPDLLGAALTSIHGALEDRFRHLLATTAGVPEREHARILDVSKVQWSELIDLMRLHRGLSAEDATLIRTMNRERQSIAHGGRFRGKRASIERYATFALGFFPTVTTALDLKTEPSSKEAAKPATKPKPAAKPTAEAKPAAKPATEATPKPAKPKPAAPVMPAVPERATQPARKVAPQRPMPAPPVARRAPSPSRVEDLQARVRHNPGLMMTIALFLIVICFALGALIRPALSDQEAKLTPIIPALPAVAVPLPKLTTAELNLRAEPGLNAAIITTIPEGTQIEQGVDRVQRDQLEWVRVRYAAQEGWVDTRYLRNP